MFVHENRIRQAASGVGAAQFCVNESVKYAQQRQVFGRPLWRNQAIQFPLAEMQTRCEMVRNLVYKTAWHLDRNDHMAVSDKVSMANYQANRLVCEAADLAIQVHGGIGYTWELDVQRYWKRASVLDTHLGNSERWAEAVAATI